MSVIELENIFKKNLIIKRKKRQVTAKLKVSKLYKPDDQFCSFNSIKKHFFH